MTDAELSVLKECHWRICSDVCSSKSHVNECTAARRLIRQEELKRAMDRDEAAFHKIVRSK